MRITRSPEVGADRAASMTVEDELGNLRIDGYDVVFVRRVGLLPAEIDERATAAEVSRSGTAPGAGRG